LEALKDFARSLNRDKNKYYLVSVSVALIIVLVFLGSYYVLLKPPEKKFTIIYLLDSQEEAVDYPELLEGSPEPLVEPLVEFGLLIKCLPEGVGQDVGDLVLAAH